ncbi:hypothetical protein DESC_770057 [Desulfosarcina cetonica]|uniref:hypothetical protein n=1 Tax=Desulfosarcina cetonica TaxID=90730 RepID=UPI0006D0557E|nr:hypothetical protein [Desulfosarcina cetonica]VTR69682.1 hypothetical protein DESC_770057 [Desulfosarcina cetonica]
MLLFTSQLDRVDVFNLFAAILAHASQGMHFFSDLEHMRTWLNVPPRRFSTAVLLPTDRHILTQLVQLQDFFQDRKVILSLPCPDRQSVALAHRLRPIYIARDPGELCNIILILRKISQTNGSQTFSD